jgi:hypothetical protein
LGGEGNGGFVEFSLGDFIIPGDVLDQGGIETVSVVCLIDNEVATPLSPWKITGRVLGFFRLTERRCVHIDAISPKSHLGQFGVQGFAIVAFPNKDVELLETITAKKTGGFDLQKEHHLLPAIGVFLFIHLKVGVITGTGNRRNE